MASEVIGLYVSLISKYFTLTDMAVSSPSENGTGNVVPSLIPQGSHSLTTSYYFIRILHEIQECVNEVLGMDVSSEASANLKSLLESARWKFESMLTSVWLRGERR